MAGYHADKVLEALEEANDVWEKTALCSRREKLEFAQVLWRYEHFSLPQIAKIVRVPARYVYEELRPNKAKGGRFEPETLSTLTRIRRAHMLGQRVPDALIRMGVKGGTSYSCLTALTGISYGAYYEVARKAADRAEQDSLAIPGHRPKGDAREWELKWQERRKEVFALRENGLTQEAIGHAVGLDKSMVGRILRGQR